MHDLKNKVYDLIMRLWGEGNMEYISKCKIVLNSLSSDFIVAYWRHMTT